MRPHKSNWVNRALANIAPRFAIRREYARRALEASYYRSASTSRLRNDWLTTGMSTTTPPASELTILRTRSRDANRNDPIASGATDTLKINIVGSGLIPQSGLRYKVLGISPERARELQRQAEYVFTRWAAHADSANILDFAEMQILALAKIIEDGEVIAIPTWASEPWRPYGRCIELVESDRLSSPRGDYDNIVNGIQFGDRGQPVKYWIEKQTKNAYYIKTSGEYHEIPARDKDGRPKILHVFPSKRVGQTRGIPYFAPVLSYFKDISDYLEAETVAARVAACLAVFITKQDPMATAIGLGTETEASTNARIQNIEPGLVGYLNPGEAINVVDPKRPGDSFGAFIESMFRIIGVSIGLPYELLIKDFSKTNYSSARAAILEGRRMFTTWRIWFARKFCQPIYDLVLEEAYLRGEFDAPDFYRWQPEYCRAQWVGPGWGWVDPTKEIEAANSAIKYGLSTYAQEASSQGADWEEIFEQRKREEDYRRELGLNTEPAAASSTQPAPQSQLDEGGSDAEAE